MTDTPFALPGYPASYRLPSGAQVTLRPMVPEDKQALLAFFRRVSPEDRLYLKDDVTSPAVIERWAQTLDYREVLPLLALVGDTVIGDATLHHSRVPVFRHVAEVRVVIDPAYRRQGLGRLLLQQLVAITKDEDPDLEKITFEIVADTEQAAQRAAASLGFVPVEVSWKHVRYYSGDPHDLVTMELQTAEFKDDEEMPDLADSIRW